MSAFVHFLSVFVLLAAAGVAAFGEESTSEVLQKLEDGGFSGVVLIAKGDTVLHEQGYGFASCDESVANAASTVHVIGSITKMFTAAAIGQLAAAEKLQLDGTLADYFDDVPEDKAAITIEQLLRHTSGLRPYHETGRKGDFEAMDRSQAFDVVMRQRLRAEPGELENYSNSGYTLLAMIIEEVSGKSYTDYIRDHLLIPAGMTSSGFWGQSFDPIASTPNEVLGCSSSDQWDYSWVLVGNGGMVSTIGDMYRWVRALKGERVLNNKAKVLIGFDRRMKGGFGSAGGSSQHEFNATVQYHGDSDITVVAISNRDTMRAESFARSLMKAVVRDHEEQGRVRRDAP